MYKSIEKDIIFNYKNNLLQPILWYEITNDVNIQINKKQIREKIKQIGVKYGFLTIVKFKCNMIIVKLKYNLNIVK